MLTAKDLHGLSRAELASLLRRGHPVRPEELAGSAYRGVSLGLPSLVERLTWKTFQKAFVRDGDGVRGWNVRVEQRGVDAPTSPRVRRGRPWTFGHFRVVDARGRAPSGCDAGVLLDYGAYGAWLDPMSRLRDPLVAVEEGSSELLLGWSYLDLGFPLGTPSYFTLEREGAVSFVPEP